MIRQLILMLLLFAIIDTHFHLVHQKASLKYDEAGERIPGRGRSAQENP